MLHLLDFEQKSSRFTKFFKMSSRGGVDDDLDAMLDDLGSIEIGAPVLPAHW